MFTKTLHKDRLWSTACISVRHQEQLCYFTTYSCLPQKRNPYLIPINMDALWNVCGEFDQRSACAITVLYTRPVMNTMKKNWNAIIWISLFMCTRKNCLPMWYTAWSVWPSAECGQSKWGKESMRECLLVDHHKWAGSSYHARNSIMLWWIVPVFILRIRN